MNTLKKFLALAAASFWACSESDNPQNVGVWVDEPAIAERLSSSSLVTPSSSEIPASSETVTSSNSIEPESSSRNSAGSSSGIAQQSSSSTIKSSSSVYYPPIGCGAGYIGAEGYDPAGFVDSLVEGRVEKFTSGGMPLAMAKDSARKELYNSLGIEVSEKTESEYMFLIDGTLYLLYKKDDLSEAKKTFAETGRIDKDDYCFSSLDELKDANQGVRYKIVPGGCALPDDYYEMVSIVSQMVEDIWLKCNDLPKCEKSVYGTFSKDGNVVCRDSGWVKPKQIDLDTKANPCDMEGKTQEAVGQPGLYYVCHDNLWVEFYKAPCSNNNDRVRITRYDDNWFQQIYICYEKEWRRTWFWYPDMPYEYYFNENIEYGSFEDPRDGHVYRTVEYNGETWLAENLKYYDENDAHVKGMAECPKEGCSVTGYFYTWSAANYACPAGWKLPSKASFSGLTKDLDYCSQISPFGAGYNAHDIYGLSIIKIGDGVNIGYTTQFWVSEKDENGENYSFFQSSSKRAFVTQAELSSGYTPGDLKTRLPIRCVKE